MNIAIFADVHGRILLALKLCARWQQETGEALDLILQAGDMGIYPSMDRLDSATLRYAQREPTELGFMQDFRKRDDASPVAATFAALDCPFVFVRGNHEDQDYLDRLERAASGPTFAVDAYGRLLCLKTGEPLVVTGRDGSSLSVLGIGRIGPTSERQRVIKDTHIQPAETAKLGRVKGHTDVLLTHDAPPRGEMGIPAMRAVLDRMQPRYHFYGHIGGPLAEGTDVNGTTHFCKLADLEWHEAGKVVRAGSMAILRWQGSAASTLEIIDAPWFRAYTAHTWRHV